MVHDFSPANLNPATLEQKKKISENLLMVLLSQFGIKLPVLYNVQTYSAFPVLVKTDLSPQLVKEFKKSSILPFLTN